MPRALILLAIALECLALVPMFSSMSTVMQMSVYVILHALATPLLARALWHQLPRRYRVPVRSSLLFLIVMIACIPLVGALGLLWGLSMALKVPRKQRVMGASASGLPALPFTAPQVHSVLPYSSGALPQILRYASAPLKRVKAVMATRQMPLQRALPIMQIALRDNVDDVRLLAFAMRDSQEKTLTEQIQHWQEELSELPAHKAACAHALLAHWCFELLHTGLVQGAVRLHWLKQGLHHAQNAPDSIAMFILRARFALQGGQTERAIDALRQAQTAGAAPAALAPYFAELVFLNKDFGQIPMHLTENDFPGLSMHGLAQVKSWWNGKLGLESGRQA